MQMPLGNWIRYTDKGGAGVSCVVTYDDKVPKAIEKVVADVNNYSL